MDTSRSGTRRPQFSKVPLPFSLLSWLWFVGSKCVQCDVHTLPSSIPFEVGSIALHPSSTDSHFELTAESRQLRNLALSIGIIVCVGCFCLTIVISCHDSYIYMASNSGASTDSCTGSFLSKDFMCVNGSYLMRGVTVTLHHTTIVAFSAYGTMHNASMLH